MSIKDEVLFVWLLMLMVMSFFLSHVWSVAVFAIQKAVALGVLPLLVVWQLAPGIARIHFSC